MFERFTERARRVVVLAQEEARLLGHGRIGTEHILLGLICEGEGVAAEALEGFNVSLEAVRMQVEEVMGRGEVRVSTLQIPFTARAKKVLELTLREALQLGDDYIGTEHILLAIVREGDGVAMQVVTRLGVDPHGLRQAVIRILAKRRGREPADVSPEAGAQRSSVLPVELREQILSTHDGSRAEKHLLVRELQELAAELRRQVRA